MAPPEATSTPKARFPGKSEPGGGSGAYHIDPACVWLYRMPDLRVVKVSFPRPVVRGRFGDRDIHSGQQYIRLADLPISRKQES
jgi:hypothetical protein